MKRFLAIALLTLALSVIVRAQDHTRPPSLPSPSPSPAAMSNPAGWVMFNSEAGRFSALMPEIPTDQPQTTQSEHGPYTTHMFVVRGLKSVFLIGYVDYDPSFNFNATAELDMNRENFIKGVKATLIDNKRTTLDGYQAIEFSAETAEKIFKSRVYLVGRRPYQLVTVTTKGVDDSANISRFFSSFKVRPR